MGPGRSRRRGWRAEDKEETRGLLVEFLKLQANIARSLDSELREAINPPDIPIANDDKTGANVAYSTLNVMSACDWINDQDEPILNKIFRIVALLLRKPSREYWQEFFELVDELK